MGQCVVAYVSTDCQTRDRDCLVGPNIRIRELASCIVAIQIDCVARYHTRKCCRVGIEKGSGVACVVINAI